MPIAGREQALVQELRAERGADLLVAELLDRERQRAVAQDRDQVVHVGGGEAADCRR